MDYIEINSKTEEKEFECILAEGTIGKGEIITIEFKEKKPFDIIKSKEPSDLVIYKEFLEYPIDKRLETDLQLFQIEYELK